MHKLLDEYLCKKYPKIFADRNKPMNQTCMCWGFSHNNGWFLLLDVLCRTIQDRIDHASYQEAKTLQNFIGKLWNKLVWNPILYPITNKCFSYNTYQKCYKYLSYSIRYVPKPIPQVVAAQVKEKFAGLRFYYKGGDDVIDGMVRLAEALSYHICEDCGVMNELVTHNSKGWNRTTCPCCTEAKNKANHTKNRDMKLVKLLDKVRNEPKLSPKEQIKSSLKTIEEVENYK